MLNPANRHDALLTSEFLPVMKNMVDVALDTWLKGAEDGCSLVYAHIWTFSSIGIRCHMTECVTSCFPAESAAQ